MPLFSDATALIALGELRLIHALERFSKEVVITPTIQAEVKKSSGQIYSAIAAGWMRVVPPTNSNQVSSLKAQTGLDDGEAELICVASSIDGLGARILVDEGSAYRVLKGYKYSNLLCVAHVLHELETAGEIASAHGVMIQLLQSGYYAWSKHVRPDYLAWCGAQGILPLPS